MAAVATYIHSKGLKAGIYTDAGTDGCGGTSQGSYGHYAQDMLQFEQWGFDFVKVDWCGGKALGLDPATQYGQIRDAIATATAQTGHPMAYLGSLFDFESGKQSQTINTHKIASLLLRQKGKIGKRSLSLS